ASGSRSPPRDTWPGSPDVSINPVFAGRFPFAMEDASGRNGVRNGVYGGWTHAGKHRIYVRVPTALKQLYVSANGNGGAPQVGPNAHRPRSGLRVEPRAEALDQVVGHESARLRSRSAGLRHERPAGPPPGRAGAGR